VCGVTSLGFDHMELLGDTLPKIAREKGGILKRGSPAWSVAQPDDAMEALRVGGPAPLCWWCCAWLGVPDDIRTRQPHKKQAQMLTSAQGCGGAVGDLLIAGRQERTMCVRSTYTPQHSLVTG
jgi:hypothetical protein